MSFNIIVSDIYKENDKIYSWKEIYFKSFENILLNCSSDFKCLRILNFESKICNREFVNNERDLIYESVYNKIKDRLTDDEILRKRLDNFWEAVKTNKLNETFVKKYNQEPYEEAKKNTYKLEYCQSLIKECLTDVDNKFLTMGEQINKIMENSNEL